MEASTLGSAFIPIDHASRIAECRSAAAYVAEVEGLSPDQEARAAIVVSELVTNLVKYAQRGIIQISPLSPRGEAGIEILSLDYGPGIANVHDAMRDGESSGSSYGTGLGAVRRLSDDFDIYSRVDRGSVVFSQILRDPAATRPAFTLGVTIRPVSGETLCGDSWSLRIIPGVALLMVADGLGHGFSAAEASAAAGAAFDASGEDSPTELVNVMHRALRGTRGAAIAAARWHSADEQVRFSGLGNIAGWIVSPGRSQGMVSQSGTAGHEARHIKEFSYSSSGANAVIMHSDGLSSNWNLAAYPGLFQTNPSIVSAILYRDAARDRDDACVVVGRWR